MTQLYDEHHIRIEHPIDQEIISINLLNGVGAYTVGEKGVSRIEAAIKSGPYSHLPYIRVWAGDNCVAEICQHNLAGVFFFPK